MPATMHSIEVRPTIRRVSRPCSSDASKTAMVWQDWRKPSSIAGLADRLGSPERVKPTIDSKGHAAAPAGARHQYLKDGARTGNPWQPLGQLRRCNPPAEPVGPTWLPPGPLSPSYLQAEQAAPDDAAPLGRRRHHLCHPQRVGRGCGSHRSGHHSRTPCSAPPSAKVAFLGPSNPEQWLGRTHKRPSA